jgi:hypothetical protein
LRKAGIARVSRASRLGSGSGNVRNTGASSWLNAAVVAPIASPNDAAAARFALRLFRSIRNPNRKSAPSDSCHAAAFISRFASRIGSAPFRGSSAGLSAIRSRRSAFPIRDSHDILPLPRRLPILSAVA